MVKLKIFQIKIIIIVKITHKATNKVTNKATNKINKSQKIHIICNKNTNVKYIIFIAKDKGYHYTKIKNNGER